jgi:hypothetical protein
MRQKIPVSTDEVKGHTLDLQSEEPIGSDVAHLPELRLPWSNRDGRHHGAVNGNEFLIIRPTNRAMFKKDDPFR